MASQPVKRRLLAEIEKSGGWDHVLERMESGETVASIARTFGVSRGFFSRILHRDAERSALATAARLKATEAWGDEVKDIADNVAESRDAIAKAKLQIDSRLSLAAVFNPDRFGKRADTSIQVNIGQLHLDALRQRAVTEALPVIDVPALPPGEET